MRVYLDNNATAPLRPEARAAMMAALDHCGNASSIHAEGRAARLTIETARAELASLAGASPDDVIFTGSGTEANALSLNGALQAAAESGQRITRLIISAIEHDSVRACAERGENLHPGLRVMTCPVDGAGRLELSELRRLLAEGKGRALVSVMAVNNETGVVQPVAQAASIARDHGALVHCDAVQAAGRLSFKRDELGADYLTLSAHKIGGPQGVGALIKKPDAPLAAQMLGGRQEFGFRAGTQNVAAIAGFGAAAKALATEKPNAAARQRLEEMLKAACPEAIIFGADAERVGNTTCIAAPHVSAETMLIALDLDGFAVSAGAACSSGKVTQSHVLKAMGVDTKLASCAIRISLGWQTQLIDLVAFADAWKRIIERARSRVAA